MPPGPKLSLGRVAPTAVRLDTIPRIPMCFALKMEDLPRGEPILVSLSTAQLDLRRMPPGPKPSLEPMAPTAVQLDIMPRIPMCFALKVEDLLRGEPILVSLFIARQDLPPTHPGPKLLLEPMGPFLAQQDIIPRILLLSALRMGDQPHGKAIPVNLSIAQPELPPMPPGPKLCQGRTAPLPVRLDIMPLLLLCFALKTEDLPRGELIPASLFIARLDLR